MAELLNNETFLKGVREDGSVEGYVVETYYAPCKAIGDDPAGFLRVVIDDDATDVETRVPHSALLAAGWVKSSAPLSVSRINPLCGVHGPIPCEGAGCICTSGAEGLGDA